MNVEFHGALSWADLASPNLKAASSFYTLLFGWDRYTLTGDFFGDYLVFTQGGPDFGVAGAHALADDTQRPTWTCYFRVDDVDGCATTVTAAGGQTRIDPIDIAHMARIALFADPQGAEFAVWQPGPSNDPYLIGDRSAAVWVELACHDTAAARHFYEQVFNWSAEDHNDPSLIHTLWRVGDEPVSGTTLMNHHRAPSHPAHWTPYFETAHCDTTTTRAIELGARLLRPPADTSIGRLATLADPANAHFGILTVNQKH